MRQVTCNRLLYSVAIIVVIISLGIQAVAETKTVKTNSEPVADPKTQKDKTKPGVNPKVEVVQQTVLTGFVEGFTMGGVYIDGNDYVLSKEIEYYSSIGLPVTKEKVKRGCKIKYVLSPSKEVEIMQLEKGQDDDEW